MRAISNRNPSTFPQPPSAHAQTEAQGETLSQSSKPAPETSESATFDACDLQIRQFLLQPTNSFARHLGPGNPKRFEVPQTVEMFEAGIRDLVLPRPRSDRLWSSSSAFILRRIRQRVASTRAERCSRMGLASVIILQSGLKDTTPPRDRKPR